MTISTTLRFVEDRSATLASQLRSLAGPGTGVAAAICRPEEQHLGWAAADLIGSIRQQAVAK